MLSTGTVISTNSSTDGGIPKFQKDFIEIYKYGVVGDFHSGKYNFHANKNNINRQVTIVSNEILKLINETIGEKLFAHAISYPLPLKIFLFKTYGSTPDNFARFDINVDEDPKPQFLSNVRLVDISDPWFFKKDGLYSLIRLIILINVSETLFDEVDLISKFSFFIVHSNQIFPS